MDPRPDHGEDSYKGSGKLSGKKSLITGGDSGIGRAVAIAYAREGADILIAYLNENDDAQEVKALIEKEGRKAVLIAGDLSKPEHCRSVVKRAVDEFGTIDILVNNAAHQATFKEIAEISDEEWQTTFAVNIHAMFYLTKAAVAHMKPGSAIINTASINSDMPNPMLLAYATTKGAIQNFTGGLAQMLAAKGIRANAVAPGPIWTPLNSFDNARGDGKEFWQTDAARPRRTACRTRHRLCDARRPAVELHLWNNGRGYRWKTVYLIASRRSRPMARRCPRASGAQLTVEACADVEAGRAAMHRAGCWNDDE